MGFLIQKIDPLGAPEEVLLEMWEYYKMVHAEERPGDPQMPAERQILNWRHTVDDHLFDRWIMRDDAGEIVGVAVAWRNRTQNLQNGLVRVHIREDVRRQGLAAKLAQPALDILEEDKRTRVETDCAIGSPAEAWLEGLGLKMVYVDRVSRLLAQEVDHGLMRSWIERASERASDYELQYHENLAGAEIVEKYTELLYQMNTAPLDDYEQEPEVFTPVMWQDIVAQADATQHDLHTYVAVHKPSGDYVGSTTIQTDRLWPEQAWQWETVTHPDHRNKGIGRWLKAALIEHLLDAGHPVERIDTGNADSNAPMLAINVAMGYREMHKRHVYQGDLAKARERMSN